jgi:hypothetical protein
MKCDVDIRKDLYANIVMSGGTTMFPGTFVCVYVYVYLYVYMCMCVYVCVCVCVCVYVCMYVCMCVCYMCVLCVICVYVCVCVCMCECVCVYVCMSGGTTMFPGRCPNYTKYVFLSIFPRHISTLCVFLWHLSNVCVFLLYHYAIWHMVYLISCIYPLRHRRAHDQGANGSRSLHHEDQGEPPITITITP